MKVQTAFYTHIGGRKCNEDAVLLRTHPTGSLCAVVCDGLGGHGGGDRASRTAVEVICSQWDGGALPQSLLAPVQEANRQILAMQTPEIPMRTTVVALAVDELGEAHVHAGDRRLYHFHQNRLIDQTLDHSASQLAVVMEEITPEQIRFHEDRNKVLRCLGQSGTLQPTARTCPLEAGNHAFLLCTDGFWEYVLEPEMEADLAAAADPEDWLQRMRARLDARIPPNNDNHTAAVVWCTVP